MPGKFDPDTLGFLIADVSRLLRAEFDRRTSEAGMGLTPGEARALSHAARAGSVRQNVLADKMGVEAMTLSGYIDRLEARGLVVRTTDPTDRRAKLVHVTEAAHAVLDEIARISVGLRADLAVEMTPAQIEALLGDLKQVRANLIAMRPECAKGSVAA